MKSMINYNFIIISQLETYDFISYPFLFTFFFFYRLEIIMLFQLSETRVLSLPRARSYSIMKIFVIDIARIHRRVLNETLP